MKLMIFTLAAFAVSFFQGGDNKATAADQVQGDMLMPHATDRHGSGCGCSGCCTYDPDWKV